jgi:hypothetical protein
MNNSNNFQHINKYNDVITRLQDYMFTEKNLLKFNILNSGSSNTNNNSNNTNTSTNTSNNNKKIINKNSNIFIPKQIDSLFWCFFLMKYGDVAYETIGNQHFLREKEEKFKYINILRNNKDILKINKIKPLSELEDDLANKNKISIKTFVGLCIIEKLNVIIIDKRKIFETINSDNQIYLINKNVEQDKYYIDLEVTNEKLDMYRNSYYKCETINDNLKSMTSYKLEELVELSNKLQIMLPTDKKLYKKDIYELLVQSFL